MYRATSLEDPNGEAKRFAMWLTSRANIVNVDRDLALDTGELKKRFKIALLDCLVIATAGKVGGSALFKKVKREMLPVLKELRRLNVLFLEELLESRR